MPFKSSCNSIIYKVGLLKYETKVFLTTTIKSLLHDRILHDFDKFDYDTL